MALELYKSITNDEKKAWIDQSAVPSNKRFYANPFEAANTNPGDLVIKVEFNSRYFTKEIDCGMDDLDGLWYQTKREVPLEEIAHSFQNEKPLVTIFRNPTKPQDYIVPFY